MILRRATLDDMPELARLYRRTVQTNLPFLPELHTPEEDAWWFSERLFATAEVWVAEGDDGPEGYIAFRPDFIEHLFVRPEAQDRGVGVMLLEKARVQTSELSLWTFQANEKARRFYERHGFYVVVETDGADNEEKTPDVLYRWRRSGERGDEST
ncbi:MAG: GNAT family N-acetyltransferase [Caulobacterales bacterium]